MFDGRFANNAWLQECPKPSPSRSGAMRFMSPSDARISVWSMAISLRLSAGRLSSKRRCSCSPDRQRARLRATLGYGRTAAGSMGNDVGFDLYPLRRRTSPWSVAERRRISRTGGHRRTSCDTQHFFQLEGEARDIAAALRSRRSRKRSTSISPSPTPIRRRSTRRTLTTPTNGRW